MPSINEFSSAKLEMFYFLHVRGEQVYRYWTREIIALQRKNEDLTHVLGSQKSFKRKDLQLEILPPWESALKWGLGARLHPFWSLR